MRKALLISPHLDDAVLSAGQFMAGRPDCDVLTVFAGIPDGYEFLSDYDRDCGFTSSRDAMSIRRDEDNAACARLRAKTIHLDFLDGQYMGGRERGKDVPERDSIINAIRQVIDEGDYEMILAPLGLMHPDHIFLANLVITDIGPSNLYLWEDLPARVLDPVEVFNRYEDVYLGRIDEKVFIGDGPLGDKAQALLYYTSQVFRGNLHPNCYLVPEIYYKCVEEIQKWPIGS